MDHHCLWTSNCVSHRSFPHFMRFLIFAVTSMCYLGYFLYIRARVIWDNRDMPSVRLNPDYLLCALSLVTLYLQYLGPSALQLTSLFVLIVVNGVTCFAVGIMMVTSFWAFCMNVTSIEGWEIERHESLVRRAKRFGGYLDGPDGIKLPIKRQEFPYDIGIWANMCQAMGPNPLTWLWPFSRTQTNESGLEFDVNDFEGRTVRALLWCNL